MIGVESLPVEIPLWMTLALSFVIFMVIAIWKLARNGQALEERLRPSVKIGGISILNENAATAKLVFEVTNKGSVQLRECLAKVVSIEGVGVSTDFPLKTIQQHNQSRQGPFNLRPQDSKRVVLVSRNQFYDSTSSPIEIEAEDGVSKVQLADGKAHLIKVGLFNEGMPDIATFKIYVDESGKLAGEILK